MKRLSVLLVLVLFGTARAEDRRQDRSKLVVMTFNAEFMWDGVEPEEGNVNFAWKFSQTEAEEHMEKVAGVIIRNNPDILNPVEIENEHALNTLNAKFLSGRGYKVYFVKGRDSTTGQDVGLLTRIDPEGNQIVRDDRLGKSGSLKKKVSKNYNAKFTIGEKKIALVGLHFLARPDDEGRKKPRQAQADAMGGVAEDLAAAGYAVIVLGDFNDYDGDVLDHIDSSPITNVLWRMKRMKWGDTTDDLSNVAEFVPIASRYTAHWDKNQNSVVNHPGEHTSIDHILISPSLRGLIEEVDIPHTHDPIKVSDHYPVVLRLKLGGAPGPAGPVVITRLLPNPPGNENVNEEATIKNVSDDDVDMTGYVLRDRVGTTWKLDPLGTLGNGEEKIIKRNNQKMAMNNSGDTIELVDGDGKVLQTVTYGRVEEDEEVLP